MPINEHLVVTLPKDVVRDIDRVERDRSRFVLEAVRHELQRRRSQDPRRSSAAPLPESFRVAEAGPGEWGRASPEEDLYGLVDLKTGAAVRWIPGEGWVEASK
jgi:hypothetical protein